MKAQESKARLYATIRHIARARVHYGLSFTAIEYLRYAAELVAPQDTLAGHTPYCYERVDDMANRLGCDPRTIRNIEHRLAELGLIERNTLANGHRHARRDRDSGELIYAHGISLAPLIKRRDELAAIATQADEHEKAYRSVRQRINQARARLSETLADLPSFLRGTELAQQARATLDAAPTRMFRNQHDLDDLHRIYALLKLELDAIERAVDNAQNPDEISDMPEKNALHKYDTTTSNLYLCKRSNDRDSLENKVQAATVERKHKKQRPVADLGTITLDRFWYAAPDHWKNAIDGIPDADWRVAHMVANARRLELGVSAQAWKRAAEDMGSTRATLALMILDVNQKHPKRPVRSVGGALVAMTRRYAKGDLDLATSFNGILHRMKESIEIYN